MKRLLFFVVVFAAFAAKAGKMYGTGADPNHAVPMSKIMGNPESYVGKEVTVSGVVLDVCAKRGCWMKLSTDYKGESVRIKVNDGEIIFPLEKKKKKAVAKGRLSKINLNLEQTREYLKDIAEENGRTFDPSTVKEGMVLYQVKATGAQID